MVQDLVIDVENIGRLKAMFGPMLQNMSRDVINGMNSAINRTINEIGTLASKMARAEYTAKGNRPVQKKKKRARGGHGSIKFSGIPGHSLYHFKPSRLVPQKMGRGDEGVSTQIRRGGSRKIQRVSGYSKPFVMRKKQGGYGLFARREGSHRKDVMFLLGPSLIQAIIKRDNSETLQEVGSEHFLRNVQDELNRILSGV